MKNQESFSKGEPFITPAAVFGVDLAIMEDLQLIYSLLRLGMPCFTVMFPFFTCLIKYKCLFVFYYWRGNFLFILLGCNLCISFRSFSFKYKYSLICSYDCKDLCRSFNYIQIYYLFILYCSYFMGILSKI